MQLCNRDEECLSNFCHEHQCSQPSINDSCSVYLQNCPRGLICSSFSKRCMPAEHQFPAKCVYEYDCDSNSFCEAGNCFRRRRLAWSCSKDNHCEDGLGCYLQACHRKCIASDPAFSCPPGLFCNGEGVCVDVDSKPVSKGRRAASMVESWEEYDQVLWILLGLVGIMVIIFAKLAFHQWLENRRKRRRARGCLPMDSVENGCVTEDAPPPYSSMPPAVLTEMDSVPTVPTAPFYYAPERPVMIIPTTTSPGSGRGAPS